MICWPPSLLFKGWTLSQHMMEFSIYFIVFIFGSLPNTILLYQTEADQNIWFIYQVKLVWAEIWVALDDTEWIGEI